MKKYIAPAAEILLLAAPDVLLESPEDKNALFVDKLDD